MSHQQNQSHFMKLILRKMKSRKPRRFLSKKTRFANQYIDFKMIFIVGISHSSNSNLIQIEN
jgi:hypothetical protein